MQIGQVFHECREIGCNSWSTLMSTICLQVDSPGCQLVVFWSYCYVREGCWGCLCHFELNHRPPATLSIFRTNICFRSVRFWLDLCKYLVWFSGYLDSNRFWIFTDLSQLRAALSQTDCSLGQFKCKLIRNSQQTDLVLLGLYRPIVTLKMATYCEHPGLGPCLWSNHFIASSLHMVAIYPTTVFPSVAAALEMWWRILLTALWTLPDFAITHRQLQFQHDGISSLDWLRTFQICIRFNIWWAL